MYFKDIIGQEEVKERLRQSARTGIVPHAQLFTEQGGAGAFPLALAYARYLNCTNRTDTDACGRCPSCLKYDELASITLEEQLICFADKFFSKTHLDEEKSVEKARHSIAKYGEEGLSRFDRWCSLFL